MAKRTPANGKIVHELAWVLARAHAEGAIDYIVMHEEFDEVYVLDLIDRAFEMFPEPEVASR